MVRVSKFALLSLLSLVIADAAPEVANSPSGAELQATFDKKIFGSVKFSSQNGFVDVTVDLSHLPETGGPFLYHIHEKPVPENGNCTGTLAHFNTYNGTTNGSTDALKELGDLSGKHGEILGDSIHTSYIDPYLSLNPGDPAYFGGLSVVVHFANNTRLACANLTAPDFPDSLESASAVPIVPDVSETLEPIPSLETEPGSVNTSDAIPSVPSEVPSIESATGNGMAINAPGMALLGLVGACAMICF